MHLSRSRENILSLNEGRSVKALKVRSQEFHRCCLYNFQHFANTVYIQDSSLGFLPEKNLMKVYHCFRSPCQRMFASQWKSLEPLELFGYSIVSILEKY